MKTNSFTSLTFSALFMVIVGGDSSHIDGKGGLPSNRHSLRRLFNETDAFINETDIYIEGGNGNDERSVLWCTGGGGWRAMVASMGYAQSFSSAGLISREKTTFDIMSSNSGGSWFMLQLFYSQAFFDNVIDSTPDDLEKFVTNWMDAYATVPLTDQENCELFQLLGSVLKQMGIDEDTIQIIGDIFCLSVDTGFDWADFIKRMLDSVSDDYGATGFTDILVNEENKISPLRGVDLHIQTALAPSAFSHGTFDNMDIFWGPKVSDEKAVFSTVTPLQWVSRQESNKWVAADDVTATTFRGIRMHSRSTNYLDLLPPLLSYKEFPKDANFRPFQSLTQLMDQDEGEVVDFALPFGGSPNVAQIASASSAVFGFLTAKSPVSFVQSYHKARSLYPLLTPLWNAAFTTIWGLAIRRIGDASVCTQWEAGINCPEDAGYFFDGGYVDNLAVAQTIGRRQREIGNKPIKVILTRHYWPGGDGKGFLTWDDFLNYFQHNRNDCIMPGQLMWTVVGEVKNGKMDTWIPMPSPQIFKERISLQEIKDAAEVVDDIKLTHTDVTTAVFHATTTENPAYGVKAGNSVSILLIDSTSSIKTAIVTPLMIKKEKPKLAELARSIASSAVLQTRIKDFLDTSIDCTIDEDSMCLHQTKSLECEASNLLSKNEETCLYKNCASGLSCVAALLWGGLVCSDGKNGSPCESNSNCDSGRCSNFEQRCKEKTGIGGLCDESSDCASGICVFSLCTDGSNGSRCNKNSDCNGSSCVFFFEIVFEMGYCSDGSDGSVCLEDSDCNSGLCWLGECKAKEGVDGTCLEDSHCLSGICVLFFCRDGSNGSRCELDADCNSGRCWLGECKAKEEVDGACLEDSDCLSGICVHFFCTDGSYGSPCLWGSDCNSGICFLGYFGGLYCA